MIITKNNNNRKKAEEHITKMIKFLTKNNKQKNDNV